MSIQLVTYANQTVTPTNDAIIYERAIDQNGIFYGCNVTVSGNEVHITGGYGIVCGREFTIQSEAIAVTLAPSGTLDGRLYVRLDLADADDPIQLLTATGNTLPPLEQDDDVNYTNGTYEMELATFTVGVSALSDVVETFDTIVGTKTYVDYVVEEETSGVWTYRKWNSGIAECWGRVSNVSIPTGWSSAGVDVILPFTFTTVEFAVAMFRNYQIARTYIVYNNTNETKLNVQTNADSAGTYSFSIMAKGTWK